MTYVLQEGVMRGDALTYEQPREEMHASAIPAHLDLREVTSLYLLEALFEAQQCRAARNRLGNVAPPSLRDPPIESFDELRERLLGK